MPSAILPVGPIQPLSNAYLMKYEKPIRMAKIPMRLSQSLPILLSSPSPSRVAAVTNLGTRNLGGSAKGCTSLGAGGGASGIVVGVRVGGLIPLGVAGPSG